MTEKVALYAFVVGEVSSKFYGRSDLAKYPLGVAEAENFFIDYKGGLSSRPGTRFVAALRDTPQRLIRFSESDGDVIILATLSRIYMVGSAGFILTGASPVSFTITGGVFSGSTSGLVSGTLYAIDGDWTGYAYYDTSDPARFVLGYGSALPDGNYTYVPIMGADYPSPMTATQLSSARVAQDLNELIFTDKSFAPFAMRYESGVWTATSLNSSSSPSPTGVSAAATPSGNGASMAYTVTAVVDGVESSPATTFKLEDVVNITTTTGEATITWTAPATGVVEYYNIYRTLVFPSATCPDGMQLGYLGRSFSTTFIDPNITPDFSKAPPDYVDFFASSNWPQSYARFQQRGIYAGMAKDSLGIVGSVVGDRRKFSVTIPPTASDAFRYVLDAQSYRPIKYLLPLRYGLLAFTDDFIAQLRGEDNQKALTATSAFAETQGYTSVADLTPTAINLDVLYMSRLFSSLYAMFYTEYTNSFTTQDILVLSSHLFSAENGGVKMVWAPEPHKLLHIIRKDGQRVTLTYERTQEVFGWARHRTRGYYLDVEIASQAGVDRPYYLVSRRLNGKVCVCLEQELPRVANSYERSWFVDCGLDNQLFHENLVLSLEKVDNGDTRNWFQLTASDLSWLDTDTRLYIHGHLFICTQVGGGTATLLELSGKNFSDSFNDEIVEVDAAEWGYGPAITSVSGLYHLEGQKVAILADGDVHFATVTNGAVSFPNEALKVIVGLPYECKSRTLPLMIPNTVVSGKPLAVRGVTFRQDESRGIAVGRDYDSAEDLASFSFEPYASPLRQHTELVLVNLLGGSGWASDQQISFIQRYPLPATVLGLTTNLDVGDD